MTLWEYGNVEQRHLSRARGRRPNMPFRAQGAVSSASLRKNFIKKDN